MTEISQVLNIEETELTKRLKKRIVAQINRANLKFSDYMQLALYDPVDGYYNNLLYKFGKEGDFITAPLVSDLFALCLARQIQELWDCSTTMRCVLEIGAGNGQLMLDLLVNLDEVIDCYYILEVSANLARLQKERLQAEYPDLVAKVVWLDTMPEMFDGVILANEVLDAQPCEVVVWEKGHVFQRVVSVDKDENLIYQSEPIKSKELLKIAKQIKPEVEPYVSEINLYNRGFIKSLANILNSGFLILIDYGYAANEYYKVDRTSGTLRGFFRHQLLDDVLTYPGLIDITSSVDFSAIAMTGIDNRFDFIGYTTLANFLLNCGLLEIALKKRETLTKVEYLKLSKQVNYLTAPDEMGEIFKVVGFSKGVDFSEWVGFSHNDRSHTL